MPGQRSFEGNPNPAAHLAPLLDDLQAGLAGQYRITRELGGGGMSRVFLAEETALGRNVVIKLLPPEFAAVLSPERFQREVRIAAALQHPHVVPLLAAGRAGEFVYYTMPFVDGESLRARLARDRELPVGEAVRLLREITDALAYAHGSGIVHRDIKPDNILLSHGHAVVMDFGIAKAFSEAGAADSLTATGMSIGTPGYMAPEQAAGDQVDHRADLYALGVVAYEMLAGEPPFRGSSVQALIGAQLTRAAAPLAELRPAVPADLAAIVHRCLEKRPADRFQTAAELLAAFDALAVTTPVAARSAAMPAVAGREWPLPRVLGWFAVASAALLGLAWALRSLAGLPDWFFSAAVALLAVGLPIVTLATVRHNRQTSPPSAGRTPLGRAVLGGIGAFSALGLFTAAYMTMRLLGIGPVGTLVAAGKLGERERLILGDFDNRTRDSLLGPAVTQAFRVDFAQSRLVSPMEPDYVRRVLRRMQRPDSVPVGLELAREIAQREGIKAVVVGGIQQVGPSLLVSAELVSAASGEVLATARETARDSTGILEAVDRVSKSLREAIGESLRSIRANPPLAEVTTGSLDALRKYSQAIVAENRGDVPRGIALLEEAVSQDSGFAMAWRKLGVMLLNEGDRTGDAMRAIERAWASRDRLTFRERKLTENSYWTDVVGENDSAIVVLESLLREHPDDSWATNNLGVAYSQTGNPLRAVEMYARSERLEASNLLAVRNQFWMWLRMGRFDSAAAALARVKRMGTPGPALDELDIHLDLARRDFRAGEARLREQLARYRSDPRARLSLTHLLAGVTLIRGKLAEADRLLIESAELRRARGLGGGALTELVRRAIPHSVYLADTATGQRLLREALAGQPLEALAERERPLAELLLLGSEIGDRTRMEGWFREFERNPGDIPGRARPFLMSRSRAAMLALRRETLTESVAELRRAPGACEFCIELLMAQAFDQMGMADSALAHYEKWDEAGENLWSVGVYHTSQPLAWRRMGELYEARGDRAKAVDYYGRFTDLWREADPVLQPRVREAKRRIADLVSEPRP